MPFPGYLRRLVVVLAAGLTSGCAAHPIGPKTPPTASAQLVSLPDPDRLWIRDAWSSLGPSYVLWASLQRIGETYEAECTLQVYPMTTTTETLPARLEARSLVVPARAVHAFLEAARQSTPRPEAPGLVHLAGIDDSGEAEVFLFYRSRSGPVYLTAGGGSSISGGTPRFTADLDQRYRLDDGGEAYRAYRALMDAMGLYPWVEAIQHAAVPGAQGAVHPTLRYGNR